MKRNRILIILVSIIVAMSAQAQQLKTFTLEDLNFGGKNYHKMVAKNRWLTWWGDELVRLDIDKCSIVDKTTGKEKTLFTLADINKWMNGMMPPPCAPFIMHDSPMAANRW